MQVGEVVFIIALNCIIIFVLYILQRNSLEKRIKHLKNEVQELEDLVAAIIEEFEEIAEMTEAKISEAQNTDFELNLVTGPEPGLTTIIDTAATDNLNLSPVENQPDENQMIDDNSTIPVIESIPAELNKPTFKTEHQRPVKDSKHQRILDLWQEGTAVEEIAKQLGTGRGEVQLILGIYKRS